MNAFVALLIRLLELLFVVGLCGSTVVFLITTVEDVETMLESADAVPSQKPEEEEK